MGFSICLFVDCCFVCLLFVVCFFSRGRREEIKAEEKARKAFFSSLEEKCFMSTRRANLGFGK